MTSLYHYTSSPFSLFRWDAHAALWTPWISHPQSVSTAHKTSLITQGFAQTLLHASSEGRERLRRTSLIGRVQHDVRSLQPTPLCKVYDARLGLIEHYTGCSEHILIIFGSTSGFNAKDDVMWGLRIQDPYELEFFSEISRCVRLRRFFLTLKWMAINSCQLFHAIICSWWCSCVFLFLLRSPHGFCVYMVDLFLIRKRFSWWDEKWKVMNKETRYFSGTSYTLMVLLYPNIYHLYTSKSSLSNLISSSNPRVSNVLWTSLQPSVLPLQPTQE